MGMNELLKVIAGLECCRNVEDIGCDVCPYEDGKVLSGGCVGRLMGDALEILREVESDGLYG